MYLINYILKQIYSDNIYEEILYRTKGGHAMKVYPVLLIIVFSLTTNIFSQVQFASHTITTGLNIPTLVYAVDVDGNGDMDVFSSSFVDDRIARYENDGNENYLHNYI